VRKTAMLKPRKVVRRPRRRKLRPKQKPFVVRVFTVVRHSEYDKKQGFKGGLSLPGVGIGFRTGEIAAQSFLKKAGNVGKRGLVVQSLTSPAVRARETTDWFLKAFMGTKLGRNHLSTVSRVQNTKVDPRIQEFWRKDLETERIFREGNPAKIEAIRKAWAAGKETGLEPKSEVDKRYRFLLDRIAYRPRNPNPSKPIQLYHFTTHGWEIESTLERISRKPISEFGHDFLPGEGFQVFVYNNGTMDIKTIRRQARKAKEVRVK